DRSGHAVRACRGGPRLRPGLGGVRRPRRPVGTRPRRPHLAAVVLDVRLRPRLPGRRGGPRRRRLLQPRRLLVRRRGRAARGGLRPAPARHDLAARPGRPRARDLRGRRAGGRGGPPHAHRRRRLRLPQPARLLRRCGLRPARARRPPGTAPARDQARRLLAAARPAHAGVGHASGRGAGARDVHRRVRPPGLGPGWGRPALVVHVVAGRPRRRRAAVRHVRRRAHRPAGPAGVRGAGPVVPTTPERRRRRAPGHRPSGRSGLELV
ncbi:MAG: FIG01122970: hypothetical protein, partial [uncultured Frankineae bacterium]